MKREKVLFFLAVIIGAILLLAPAIYNGYPLVNSDDGTYIWSGQKLETPGDRPLTYGVFLRVFSFDGCSYWLAAFFQSAILSFLVIKVLQRTVGNKYLFRHSLLVMAILALTSASWTVSEIIPDIWTGIALLALALIVAGKESMPVVIFLYLVYFCAVATHMSNIMILSGVVVLVFLFKRLFFKKEEYRKLHKHLLFLFIATWATFFTMRAPYTKSKHVFIMASFIEKGILKQYLDEYCGSKNYNICNYKNELPTDPNYFLWDQGSPLSKEGGWDATKDEYSGIISDIFSTPKYLGIFAKQSLVYSWRQLFACHLAEGNFRFPKGSHVYYAVEQNAPRDTLMYQKAWQHQEHNIVDHLSAMNNINYALTIAGLLVLLITPFVYKGKISGTLKLFVFLFIAGYLVNIWDCASFAQVNARYSSRMMWLIPLSALLYLINIKANKENNLH